MIALIQRVNKGRVLVKNKAISEINSGYVILLGIFQDDKETDVEKVADKIVNLRIMSDQEGKMNKSIMEAQGEILLVSQFTLCADLRYGRRPSFIKAKEPNEAKRLYDLLTQKIKEKGVMVKNGSFGEYMTVEIFNDGPVTIILDSKDI